MLINYGSPLEIVNTITHELRHQYQNECINGYHNVPDEVKMNGRQQLLFTIQIANHGRSTLGGINTILLRLIPDMQGKL